MQMAALRTWLLVQAIVWLPALVTHAVRGFVVPPVWWFAGMGCSYAVLVGILRGGRNVADVVTVSRIAGLLGIAASVAAAPTWWQWLGFVGCVGLDLVDGRIARRRGPTAAGAVLDMEADQLTVMTLALCIVHAGGGVHVLIVPVMRYAFVIAGAVVGMPTHDPKPVNGDNRRGRRCCAFVLIALLVALVPGLLRTAGDVATAAAGIVLAWSFASDARFLLARVRAARSSP